MTTQEAGETVEAKPKVEGLDKVAKRLKQLMADAGMGPVLVARELAGMEGRWADYGEEGTLSAWVRACLAPKTLQWFRQLHSADERLGPDFSKLLDSKALLWLAGQMDGPRRDPMLAKVIELHRKNGRNPVTILQAQNSWRRLNDRA
jgi:hypothetical protein